MTAAIASVRWAATARRWQSCLFLLLFAAIVCAPAAVMVLAPEQRLIPRAPKFEENRAAAPRPPWPRTLQQALAFPPRLEPFLQDRFGLRADLITLNNYLRFRLFGEFTSRQIMLGLHGRVLLTSHDAGAPFSMIRGICGVGVGDALTDAQADALGVLLRRTRAVVQRTAFVLAPSASAVYPEALPVWLARQCDAARPTVPRIGAKIPPAEAGAFLYLLDTARTVRQTDPVIPWASFHWWGMGAKRLIEAASETVLGRTRQVDVPMHPTQKTSDLNQFMPGLGFREDVKEPDWAAAGIERCFGAPCYADDLGPIAAILADVSRYRSPRVDGGRVLVLSDSFGAMSAGYLAEYFHEVRHFSLNNLERMTPDQVRALRTYVFDTYKPDQVVYLFHDGAILYAAARLNRLFWQ